MITARKVMSANYMLDISAKELLVIMAKDRETKYPLYILLGSIDGISKVNYVGHFGPHIYLTLDTEHESKDVWKVIYEIIENYL